jgi:hypothetical protein
MLSGAAGAATVTNGTPVDRHPQEAREPENARKYTETPSDRSLRVFRFSDDSGADALLAHTRAGRA